MAPTTNFPAKTALALATTAAVLTLYHHFDRSKGLSPAIFPEAAHLTLVRHDPATFAATPPATTPVNPPQPQPTLPAKTPVATAPDPCPASARRAISPYLIDDCGSLDPFYAALQSLERPSPAARSTAPQTVTILHYGDSPTTADLITGDVRALLQQRFGNAGHGFLLPARPWAWYGHRDTDIADKNWTISTAVGKGREEIYGIGGASFTGGPDASSHITLHDPDPLTAQATVEISYLARPDGGSLSVSANGAPLETISTADPEAATRPAWRTIPLPPATKTIDLIPTSGSVRLFGETFLTAHPGVVYSSLGLNGASTSVLSNGFNPAAWTAGLQHTRPALVVINYGTNESGFGAYVDKQYEPTLRTAIARIRAALPAVPILVMSPMDRGRRTGVDQIETFDTIPRLVAIQRRVAAELHCAFFDTFNAMGGDGTMARWYTGHPRLVAGDLIHPTPQGASLVAHLFIKDLALGYDRFLGHPPAPQQVNLIPAQPQAAGPVLRPKPSAAGQPIPSPAPPPVDPRPEPPPAPSDSRKHDQAAPTDRPS